MHRYSTLVALAALSLLAVVTPHTALAQTGGFIATLGTDTVHAERFRRTPGAIDGVIVTRVPETRIARFHMTLAADGHPLGYEVTTTDGAGTPVPIDGANGSMTFGADSVIRESTEKGSPSRTALAAPHGLFPAPSIPYVGVSYLMYEQAFAAARARGGSVPDSMIYLATMIPLQRTAQRAHVWFPAPDSAELDYFGVARSGYRFDASGALIRADWTGTTYRYHITRVADVDVESLARAWVAADRHGAGVGALSPRDSSHGSLGSVALSADYSRPARRGRAVWSDVVRPNTVWRLGADMATHFATSADITIGGTVVPAGRYTLWMIIDSSGAGSLIVNRRVNVFGTQYDPRSDLARIPLRRSSRSPSVERLTLSLANGQLEIAWGDAAWMATLAPVSRE